MADEKWRNEHTTRLHIRLMNESDKDVIEWLFQQPNKTDYIRGLIRKDMESKGLKRK
ncbi:MAG: hypothetical protein IKE36_05670 [Solobacterium sp.]|nr:hypothetical protein [Solobacterium sp.]